MAAGRTPLVSVGLPVYNGERYVGEAIRSILDQTFTDFELVIGDNASVDRTADICRAAAAVDPRVRYHRNETNLGASRNYSVVFELARGKYFKWAAHDDALAPDFLRRCVEVLETDQTVVLCHAKTATIGADGQFVKEWPEPTDFAEEAAHRRFRASLEIGETHLIWALIRTSALRTTGLLGPYTGHDLPLLGELALHGRFHLVPDVLFFHREHAKRSVRQHDFTRPHQAIGWYAPERQGEVILPQWRLFAEYCAAIRRVRAPLDDKLCAAGHMLPWLWKHRSELIRDLFIVMKGWPIVGRMLFDLYKAALDRRWQARAERLVRDLGSQVHSDEGFILVDDGALLGMLPDSWRVVRLVERDGHYQGAPESDEVAIGEVERLRKQGVHMLAVVWPSYWWFDHYTELHRHLREHYPCRLQNERVVLFDLA
jgi:GT2 family glycosyltransferase